METTEKKEKTAEAGSSKIPLQRVVIPLLPCPFCGCKAERCDCGEDGCNRIICKKCGVEMVADVDDFEHNVNVWNNRINGTNIWNKAAELPHFLQTNAIWGALRELEKMGVITINALLEG